MSKLIAAYTKHDRDYPGYINFSRDDDGAVVVTVRGDPTIRHDGRFICGYAADKGKPGRCTPGDENCNNYCNLAPEKGPMADQPKTCVQIFEGGTASVRFSADEWATLCLELANYV